MKLILKKKLKWLEIRGNRGFIDLFKDEQGEYVIMYNGKEKEDVKVYLPAELWGVDIPRVEEGGQRGDSKSE